MNWDMKQSRSTHIFGNAIVQTWYDLYFLNEVLTDIRFDTLIELGTYRGGLAVFFGLHAFSKDSEVLTFDIRPAPEGKLWPKYTAILPITHYSMDVFCEEAKNIVAEKAEAGRVLVFCDGGEKPKDFKTYAPLIEANDVIMAHDKGLYIHQHEVDQIAERNGLVPFLQEGADKVGAAIFSFVKKHARRDKRV